MRSGARYEPTDVAVRANLSDDERRRRVRRRSKGSVVVHVKSDAGDVASGERTEMDLLHEIGSRMAAADPLHAVLSRVVHLVSTIGRCDSCFIYVLE